ncbi:MAG TPA: GNAT family N-acetyltransferase, partial [Enterococcus aquimarinus]|nr:GNAT family N-acetyltransferase [Enterococcus aquimarinus]
CGVGRALIAEGHRRAKRLGYSFSLVLGSENYYPKFGYLPAVDFGVTVPEGIPSMNFMACPLTTIIPQLDGTLRYASEFGVAE